MGSRTKTISLIFKILLFIGGLIIGYVLKHYPYLTLDKDVNIIDLAMLVATIAIAFMIPIYIQKFIEDSKGVKASLVEELKELVILISSIKRIITDSHANGSFAVKDRDDILFVIYEAELKITSIEEQFKIAYESKCEEFANALKGFLYGYQDYLTGGEMMLSSFIKIDDRFYRENSTEYSKIETGIKTLIQRVHKL